jgi:hypothetical protein
MFSSLAVVLTACLFAGAILVVALAARARSDDTIARVLYDTEHPAKRR